MADRGAVGAGVSGFAETLSPFLQMWANDDVARRTQQQRVAAQQQDKAAEQEDRATYAPIYAKLVAYAATQDADPMIVAQLAGQLGASTNPFYQKASAEYGGIARELIGGRSLSRMLSGTGGRSDTGTPWLTTVPPPVPESRMPGMGTKITPPAPLVRKAPASETPIRKPPVAPIIERPMTGEITRTGTIAEKSSSANRPARTAIGEAAPRIPQGISILDLTPAQLAEAARMPEFANVVRTEELRQRVESSGTSGGRSYPSPEDFVREARPSGTQMLSDNITERINGMNGLSALFRARLNTSPNFSALQRGLDVFDPAEFFTTALSGLSPRIQEIAKSDENKAKEETIALSAAILGLSDEIQRQRADANSIKRIVDEGRVTSAQVSAQLDTLRQQKENDTRRPTAQRERTDDAWDAAIQKMERLREALLRAGR